ncbi:hypothetical protein ACK3TF_001065 [Chlorella vulgaris]
MVCWAARWAARSVNPLIATSRHLQPRALSSSSFSADELQDLRGALLGAIEAAETASPSATQLMLETDPSARSPRSTYELHYAELALVDIRAALAKRDALRQRLGSEVADRLLKEERLQVAVAECLMARDRTARIIETLKRQQEANEVTCDT